MDRKYMTEVACPDCRQKRWVQVYNLKVMKSLRCKTCMLTARNKARAKHGLERHPLYTTWTNMLRRVDKWHESSKNKRYLGLDVDPAWRDVTTFVTWALGAGWKPDLSIERRDIHKGYWPDNCTFIPKLHQARNRRDNSVTLTLARQIQKRVAGGEVRYRVAKEFAATTGVPLSTLVKVAYGYNWK
jgi:hypothetical protein